MATEKELLCPADAQGTEFGNNWILGIYDSTGTNVLAVSGQQSLTINRSADTIETTNKDSNGWKQNIGGLKEWSIDIDGAFVRSSESHKALAKAFSEGTSVCVKVTDKVKKETLYGGVAIITDYPIEAPYDDAVTYSMSLQGSGKLYDFSVDSAA